MQDTSAGVTFGLFAGDTTASSSPLEPNFVTSFFAAHSVDPTMSPEGAVDDDDSEWTTVQPGAGVPLSQATIHPKVIAGQW